MNGLAANKSFDETGRFVASSASRANGAFESRLAHCLSERRKTRPAAARSPTGIDRRAGFAGSQSAAVEAVLVGLFGSTKYSNPRSSVNELCRSLETAAIRRKQLDRPFDRAYGERLQLAAMLPIYLNADADNLDAYVAKSTQLAAEAGVVLELNDVLDRELFTLINTDHYKTLHPVAVIQQAFDFNLSLVARVSAHHSADINESTRLAYWAIAEQILAGATHLHVPSNLDVGKIVWPRVREHWQELNAALINGSVASKDVAAKESEISLRAASTPAAHASAADSKTIGLEAAACPSTNQDFIEIRSSNDPRLAETLAIQLEECRDRAMAMGLAVFQRLGGESCIRRSAGGSGPLQKWHIAVLEGVQRATTGLTSRGFLSDCGDLALVFERLDRTELTNLVRNLLEDVEQAAQPSSGMVEAAKIGLVAGIACVDSPSKKFKVDQLIEASWRCLSAAKNQGIGSVKSIEVY